MPIHDWTRVRANRFHDFHQSWTVGLCDALNRGGLPLGYFAMIEEKARAPRPDVVVLDLPPAARHPGEGVAADLHPPRARFVIRCEGNFYARKGNRITVRHPDGNVVAVVEIVSPGNKSSRDAVRSFARKAVEYLHAGVHLLIVDLFPPSRRDPQGIHKVIWDRLCDEPFTLPSDKPLTVVSYAVSTEIVAYVEPVAVGDSLPDAALFLAGEGWVRCPLEATYQTAWEQFPAPLRGPLESGPAS